MMSDEAKRCIDACLFCYQTCLGTAMNHCLEAGGKHVEPQHFRLMMACAEICRTSAHFMLITTPHHKHTQGMCGDLYRMRGRLRAHRGYGRMRYGVPSMRRVTCRDGTITISSPRQSHAIALAADRHADQGLTDKVRHRGCEHSRGACGAAAGASRANPDIWCG